MQTVLVVFGSRPEYIKLFPVVKKLKESKKFRVIFCATGQHHDLLWPTIRRIGIYPNVDLAMAEKESRTINYVWADVLLELEKKIKEYSPNLVIVQGDTASAISAAACAYNSNIPIAHVESGVRTHDLANPFPEEGNRQMISRLADFNFCPTEYAKRNLLKENVGGKIYVVGNTEVDAAFYALDNCKQERFVDFDEYVIVTLHRRESIGYPLKNICEAIKKLSKEIPVVFPVHMNPEIRKIVFDELKNSPVALVDPFDFIDFCHIMAGAKFIVTDSGGIQESAAAIGIPVIVARDKTDRPEAIESGNAILGSRDNEQLYKTLSYLLQNEDVCGKMRSAANPYGEGNAAEKITEILAGELCA